MNHSAGSWITLDKRCSRFGMPTGKYHFSWSLMKRGVGLWMMELRVLKIIIMMKMSMTGEMSFPALLRLTIFSSEGNKFHLLDFGCEKISHYSSEQTPSTCKRRDGVKIEIMQKFAWSVASRVENKFISPVSIAAVESSLNPWDASAVGSMKMRSENALIKDFSPNSFHHIRTDFEKVFALEIFKQFLSAACWF